MPTIRITVDGQPALTVKQAAERKRVAVSSMRGELSRYRDKIRPVEHLDGRTPLYLEADVDAWWDKRPGKGSSAMPVAD